MVDYSIKTGLTTTTILFISYTHTKTHRISQKQIIMDFKENSFLILDINQEKNNITERKKGVRFFFLFFLSLTHPFFF